MQLVVGVGFNGIGFVPSFMESAGLEVQTAHRNKPTARNLAMP
jgi:hypothetical protein